jgi:hypothetical protein
VNTVPNWQDNYSGFAEREVTIANGQTESAEVDLAGRVPVGLFVDGTLTGTTVTFLAARVTAGDFLPVQDGEGAAYSVTVASDQYIPLDPSKFWGVRFLKVKSGSAEGAARTVYLQTRKAS